MPLPYNSVSLTPGSIVVTFGVRDYTVQVRGAQVPIEEMNLELLAHALLAVVRGEGTSRPMVLPEDKS